MSNTCTFHNQNSDIFAWRDYNKLREAIRYRDINLVKHLLANGARVNGYSDSFLENTPLHLAVISRCSEIVGILLENGADTNVGNAVWDSPLIMAARIENFEIIDLLLSSNVQVYEHSIDHIDHLHIACMRNRLDIVKKLLSMEHVNSLNHYMNKAVHKKSLLWPGFTPLHFAVYYGAVETVEYLLKCGANMMVRDSKGMTPLHWAEFRRNEEIIDLLLAAHKYEFNNPVGPHGLSHFHIACTRDNPSIVKHFLKLGVDIDLKVQASNRSLLNKWQPINFAMYYECPKVIELLLKMNAYYRDNSADVCHLHLLAYEFKKKDENIYSLFISNKNDLNGRYTRAEKTPYFHLACIKNNVEIMSSWLSRNSLSASELNVLIWNEYTSLHLAAKHNSVEATKLLLANGADFTVQDSLGKTPLHVAFERRHTEVVDEIARYITKFTENLTDVTGLSFLHILCSTNRLVTIENFLSKGIDVNAPINSEAGYWAGSTPMDIACKFEQSKVVALLHRYKADIFIKNGSISDHFSLVFESIDVRFYLSDIEKILLENLIQVLDSPSLREKYSNHCGVSPLHALCLNIDTDVEPLKQYLMTHRDEINQIIEMPLSYKYHKCTPMHLAMKLRDTERGKVMMEAGADPLMVDGAGNTPLESTILTRSPAILSDEEIAVFFPLRTPAASLKPSHFFIACLSNAFEFVRDILSNVDDVKVKNSLVNCRNDADETILHLLSQQEELEEDDLFDRKEMVKLLLEHGADANAMDYQLQTPLFYADDAEVLFLLIDYGADVNLQNLYGETPLHVIWRDSQANNIVTALDTLLKYGADINIKDRQGRTCLTIMKNFHQNDGLSRENAIPVLKHMMKLRMIGSHIDKENEDAYFDLIDNFDNLFNESAFRNECEKEIELLKPKYFDHFTTLYDILLKNSNEMARHCDNDALQSLVESNSKDFPIYGFLLHLRVKEGRTRKPLIENSKKPLTFLIGKSLPPVCIEMILSHLSAVDLKHVIMSENRSE